MIEVFGMPGCAGCEVVKKMLESNGVKFDYINVMNPDSMGYAEQRGVRGVPTTFIPDENGLDKVIVGSTVAAIQQIRDLAGIN